jgi:hypothetical protein
MSPLVRKELRSISPLWLLAMVLAILPVWLVWPDGRGIFSGAPSSDFLIPRLAMAG